MKRLENSVWMGRALQKSGVFDQLVVGSEASLHLGDRAAF